MRPLWTPILIPDLCPALSFLVLSPLLHAAPPPDCRDRPELQLVSGEQHFVRTAGLERFSIGSPTVARALPRPGGTRDSILLKAVSPGTTDLWIRTEKGCERRSIRVHATDPRTQPVIPPEMGRLLSRLLEVEVHHSAAGALLRGEVQTETEASRIDTARILYPDKLIDESTLAPELLAAAFLRLTRHAEESSPSLPIEISQKNGRIEVRGNIDSPEAAHALRRRLRAAFPLFDWRVEAMPDSAPTLAFKVYLLEIRRNRFGDFGLEWPEEWKAGIRAVPLQFGGIEAFELRLKSLSGDGSARILSEPEISVRAPGQAELFSGGEIPVRTTRNRQSNVDWRPFGLSLKLRIERATGNRVRLEIETELSALDAETREQALPRVQTNRLRTQVDGTFGIPLLLTGLVQHGWRDSIRGLPALRDLPILGPLFSSESYQNHHSELVAVLLPRRAPTEPQMDRFLESPIPQGPRPVPRNFIHPEEERQLRSSPEFPWNALRSEAGR